MATSAHGVALRTGRRGVVLAVLAVAGGACGTGDGGGPRLPPPPSCEGVQPLELGRCVDAISGLDCMGYPSEDPRFEPLGDGDPLALVTGPQGSSMFVIAVRTQGIDAGNPDRPVGVENPLVEITVVDESGTTVAVLRRYSAFLPDPDRPGTSFNGGFFVVIDDVCREGALLEATAVLEDVDGNVRCGGQRFTAVCGE